MNRVPIPADPMRSAKVQTRSFYGLTLGYLILFPSVSPMTAQEKSTDRGSNNPINALQSSLSNAISKAEKAIPRSQKYSILNGARHRLMASKESDNPQKLFVLASEYQRFRFYDEAIDLFEKVIDRPRLSDELKRQTFRALGELEFVANNDVGKAVKHFAKAVEYSDKESIQRAELLGRLASYYLIDGQTEKMLETFDEFNRLPEVIKKRTPDSYLKANLYMARFAEDIDEVKRFLEKARKIVNETPSAYSASLILSVNAENNRRLPWNAPERIRRLAKLCQNKRFAQESQIRKIAVEVLFAYFLQREKEWDQFSEFTETTLELLQQYEVFDEKDQLSDHLICQTTGLFVGASEAAKRKWDKKEIQNSFNASRTKFKRIRSSLPIAATDAQKEEIVKALTAGIRLLETNLQKRAAKERAAKAKESAPIQ